jgi:dTDP-4-dehydrorhamnose 3,5-epimerase
MIIEPTRIKDLVILKPSVFEDERGFFMESFNKSKLAELNPNEFVQDNHSKSGYGVLRGLHYQKPPYAQTKIVRVTKGKVLDVAVDIRSESETYGQWFSLELSEENKLQLYIPRGFAHGFVCLTDEVEFVYKCDNYYNKASEGGIIFDDLDLNIDWSIPNSDIILSDKDKLNQTFKEYKANPDF